MPQVGGDVHVLRAPDRPMDEATLALLEQAADDAYRRGRRDGAAEATAAVASAAAQVTAIVQDVAVQLRRMAAEVDVELALQIARAVLDREPADDTAALLARIQAALAALDDDALTIHVSAEAAAPLAEALSRADADVGGGARVVADPAVAPGDARVSGRWSRADLTREGALEAVSALLREGAL